MSEGDNSEAFGRGEATMRNKRKGYQSIYIPRQQKTVVSTKTDNSNLRLLKSLAYSNYMPGVWERYAIIIASLL